MCYTSNKFLRGTNIKWLRNLSTWICKATPLWKLSLQWLAVNMLCTGLQTVWKTVGFQNSNWAICFSSFVWSFSDKICELATDSGSRHVVAGLSTLTSRRIRSLDYYFCGCSMGTAMNIAVSTKLACCCYRQKLCHLLVSVLCIAMSALVAGVTVLWCYGIILVFSS